MAPVGEDEGEKERRENAVGDIWKLGSLGDSLKGMEVSQNS